MIIVWRGWGVLAPLILMATTFILMISVESYTHTVNYAGSHRWVYSIGCLLGAIPCWYIGKALKKKPGRMMIDVKTGRRIELKEEHSCFFIDFEYWAIIGIAASVITLFLK